MRPSRCPRCDVAGYALGERVLLHGHGLYERQVRGPLAPSACPSLVVIAVRRYRCVCCGAVSMVVPRGMVRRRLYSGCATALALALWVAGDKSHAEIREAISPWAEVGAHERYRWRSLGRWARDAAAGRLFSAQWAAVDDARKQAGQVVATLAAHAPPGDREQPMTHRVWKGALRMA